jgi:LmbE family N-acetylglucosaminyl deacetylase
MKECEGWRVLAMMPHPDDMEILCVGTLIRLHDLGWEVHVATMTPGDKGSATLPPEEIAAIRRVEAQRGAEAIGAASYRCLEFADCEIVLDNAARRRVAGVLRAVDPHLVFTTPPDDYMLDHEITSRLVRDACFNAPMRNYAAEGSTGPSSGIPYLYYTDAIEGHDIFGQPSRVTDIVDISAQIERKVEALACHDSQRAWLRKQHGMDNYIESMKNWSAMRGREIGATFGEAFCQHRGHPHPTDDLLGRLFDGLRRL